jgi:hypothetical protein
MIIFYDKRDGKIFATTDGRVHDEKQLECYIDSGIGTENIGKYIIGWTEDKDGRIAHNLDKMELLKKFEDHTPESPLMYRIDIEKNQLIKK